MRDEPIQSAARLETILDAAQVLHRHQNVRGLRLPGMLAMKTGLVLTATITKTSTGDQDYIQIMSEDMISVNVVLVADRNYEEKTCATHDTVTRQSGGTTTPGAIDAGPYDTVDKLWMNELAKSLCGGSYCR